MQRLGTLLVVLWLGSVPLAAETIDVTSRTFATLRHGARLSAEFGVWNYGRNNPEYSPYPTGIGLLVIGADLAGVPGRRAGNHRPVL